MRVIMDEEQSDRTAERNQDAINQIKNEIIRQSEVLSSLQSQYRKASNVFQKGANMFLDEKGMMLASSTIALNGVALATQVALDVYKQWTEFNKEMEEYSEVMRRYGVGDTTNQTDLRRNIWTGKVVGKRRY